MTLWKFLLDGATIVVGFLGLGLTVWLGLTLVAQAPRKRTSWLAGSLLWSFSMVFTLSLLQLGKPLVPNRPWLAYDVLRWLIIPLPLVWLYLTIELLPAKARLSFETLRRIGVGAVFMLALATVAMGRWFFPSVDGEGQWEWLYYPLYLLTVLLIFVPSIVMTWRAARLARVPAHVSSARVLSAATLLTLLAAVAGVGGFAVHPDFPELPSLILLLAGAVALGGAIVLRRVGNGETSLIAFIYFLANAMAITLAYTIASAAIVWILGLTWMVLIVVVPLAVNTHWLVEWSHTLFDRLFYRKPVQRLRTELRTLVETLHRDEPLESRVTPVLARLAQQVKASAVVLAVANPGQAGGQRVLALYPATSEAGQGSSPMLILHPMRSPLTPDLAATEGEAQVVPLGSDSRQLGSLLVWPDGSRSFSDRDLSLLDEVSSQLTALLVGWEVQSHRLEEIEQLVIRYREEAESLTEQIQLLETTAPEEEEHPQNLPEQARQWVEEGLRHLHNVAYLGQHPLASLGIVEERVMLGAQEHLTHLERGKVVRTLLEELVERLRPAGPPPQEPYPAEWRLYTILYAAYMEGEPNREVMSRLYISDATFHRARRQALNSVAEALVELERAAQARNTAVHAS